VLNSQNLESGSDGWRDIAEVLRWFSLHDPTAPGRLKRNDLTRLHELRAALRQAVAGDHDQLDAVAAQYPVMLNFGEHPNLSATGPRFNQFISRVLVAAFVAHQSGDWDRLKACQHCSWVTFDRSKNRSASWCADRACSTRHRARAYRQRVRERSLTD
jgi:predicted RNA-binding Zn ribbon-like protein